MAVERVELRGSARRVMANAQVVGRPDPSEVIVVTLMLRRRPGKVPDPGTQTVSREEFAQRYGADPADIPLIEQFAADNDLTIVNVDLARRSAQLSGTIANMNEAFATDLQIFQSPRGTFRGRTGAVYIPASLSSIVTGVFGLDERPQARAHVRRWLIQAGPRAAGDTSYTPPALAKLYNFPTKGIGTGQTIAIIELGGGYTAADLKAYFTGLGIRTPPSVTAISVDGAQNQPVGDPNSADGEVVLDIEIAGAIAPGAKIAVYFAPNTDQGFLDAITSAIHDTVRKPSVVSISWGAAESSWTDQALQNFDSAFQDAALLGVTVCCAAGDDGSSDGVNDGAAHVDFPASSPNVLACGGTRLESSNGKVTREVVWNQGAGNGATGGGVSEKFPLPSYQSAAHVPVSVNPTRFKGRGVPDIAGDADPATGYQIHVDGRDAVFGGTSAVAPLWAALIALINEQMGKPVGFIQPKLYTGTTASQGTTDVTLGNNGAYQSGPGWDPCTGWGSPNGQGLLTALAGAPSKKPAPVRGKTAARKS